MRLMPTVRTLPLLTPMALGLALATPSCLSNTNPHDDEVSSFPLEGRHAAIPCESCHGDDGFDALGSPSTGPSAAIRATLTSSSLGVLVISSPQVAAIHTRRPVTGTRHPALLSTSVKICKAPRRPLK